MSQIGGQSAKEVGTSPLPDGAPLKLPFFLQVLDAKALEEAFFALMELEALQIKSTQMKTGKRANAPKAAPATLARQADRLPFYPAGT